MNKRIRVLLTPPEPWQPPRDAYVPGTSPDPLQIYRVFSSEGVDFSLLDPHRRPLNPLYGQHPIYMGLDPARAIKVFRKRQDFDLVISVFEASCLLLLHLRRVMNFRVPIAMWDFVPTPEWPPRAMMQNLSIPRVDHLFLLSSQQREYLSQRWGAAEKTTVIHQHIDADFFSPLVTEQTSDIFSIGDDAGRDFSTLLKAVESLDIDVTVKTRKTLPVIPGQRARISQISSRISFPELRALYAGAQIVVLPINVTLNVSGVGSLLEAMAMGKPIVVSDNPPLRDFIIADETAVVVPPNDPRAMRGAIEALLRDPEKQRSLGNSARRLIEQKFANEPFARNFARKIRELLPALQGVHGGISP